MAGRIRSYSKSFKAQVIQECAKPDASIASVALSRSLNANLIHKWIAQRDLVLEGSAGSRALDYSMKRQAALSRYLNVPIDNNWCENQIRPGLLDVELALRWTHIISNHIRGIAKQNCETGLSYCFHWGDDSRMVNET